MESLRCRAIALCPIRVAARRASTFCTAHASSCPTRAQGISLSNEFFRTAGPANTPLTGTARAFHNLNRVRRIHRDVRFGFQRSLGLQAPRSLGRSPNFATRPNTAIASRMNSTDTEAMVGV